MRFERVYPILFAGVALLATGCASISGNAFLNPGKTPGDGGKGIKIESQPTSQTVPIGRPATFTVEATGTTSLTYQWSRNGVDIDGAIAASYTVPSVALSDSGSTYQVTVNDISGSKTSSAATLTAGPRAPKQGDLRLLLFQQTSAPGLGVNAEASAISTNTAELFPGAIGSPLEIGSSGICTPGVAYQCGWSFFVEYLPQTENSLNMQYQGRDYADFDGDLQWIAAPNVVITSVDLEPANDAYAAAWVFTQQATGFDYRREIVATADVAATVAQDAAENRVVTAVSFDAQGQANLFSYGWQGDTTTTYETKTVTAAADDVVNQATCLAKDGYVISAFGGNDTDGYILVGTRVQGDSLPRTLTITTANSTIATSNSPESVYATPVAHFTSANSGQVLISEY